MSAPGPHAGRSPQVVVVRGGARSAWGGGGGGGGAAGAWGPPARGGTGSSVFKEGQCPVCGYHGQ